MIYLLSLTLLLAPTFALQFNIGPLPTNFLMMWVIVVWVMFAVILLVKKQLAAFFAFVKNIDKKIILGITGFFVAGLISLFINGIDRQKLGQFIVLFIEPISLFFLAGYTFKQSPSSKSFLLTICYLLLGTAGAYAIFQYFTLHGLPQIYWGNSTEPKRAVSFFGHPDFYSLFTAPLLAFLLPDIGELFQNWKWEVGNWKLIAWILGGMGLLLSLSRAGWVGLAAAIVVYVVFAGNKTIRKLILGGAVVITLIIVATPNLRYRVLLPFYGEKSAVSRFSLWHTGVTGIKQSPVLGLGLNGFGNNWSRLNTDPNLDTHNFPHNIFLDMWVDLGLLGLISFVWLCGLYIVRGFRAVPFPRRRESTPPAVIPRSAQGEESLNAHTNDKGSFHSSAAFVGRDDTQKQITFAITLFLICLLIQGMFDNPYFRNDLALVFWIILALIF